MMSIEELTAALDELASQQPPPTSTPEAWARLERRRARLRRRQLVAVAASVVLVLGVGVTVVYRGSLDRPDRVDTAGPGAAATAPATAYTGPEPAGCFPTIDGDLPQRSQWPSPQPNATTTPALDVAVVSTSGAVIAHGADPSSPAQRWGDPTVRYRWAQYGPDGVLYASRVATSEVVIDALTGPGQSQPVVHLPFTVNANAPAGSCPIDGYLAGFGFTSEGLVVDTHQSGPLPMSCPAPAPGTTRPPDSCQLREATGYELRPFHQGDDPATMNTKGRDLGESHSGVASNPLLTGSASSVIGEVGPSGLTISWIDNAGTYCCASTTIGTGAAISPQGRFVASSPDGHAVTFYRLLDPRQPTSTQPPSTVHVLEGKASPPIGALAFVNETQLIAAHGSTLTIATEGTNTTATVATYDGIGPIRSIAVHT